MNEYSTIFSAIFLEQHSLSKMSVLLTPFALRKAKIVYNFGLSECNRVNGKTLLPGELTLIGKEGKNESKRVVSQESGPIHPKYFLLVAVEINNFVLFRIKVNIT